MLACALLVGACAAIAGIDEPVDRVSDADAAGHDGAGVDAPLGDGATKDALADENHSDVVTVDVADAGVPDGCAFACDTATSSGRSCSAATCSYTCNAGRADCNVATAPNVDGCECASASVATEGAVGGCCTTACQTQHNNGIAGGHYYDCVALGTYNATQATAAGTSDVAQSGTVSGGWSCGTSPNTASTICKTAGNGTTGACTCWAYAATGTMANLIGLTSISANGCACPVVGDPVWN